MVRYILKKYILFLMIFSLCIPSFSFITGYEGSNFVTKAEFDSSMADFNSRLTSFESGVNSKIDSQVSTYLDRNGIWSKKDQNLINNTITAPTPGTMGYKINDSLGKVTNTEQNNVLFESNKNGLACVRCYYKTTYTGAAIKDAWWGYRLVCRDSQKNLFDDGLSINILFKNTSSVTKFCWNVYNGSAVPSAGTVDGYDANFLLAFIWPDTPIYTNIYFFVNSKETINWYFNAIARSGFNNNGEDDNNGGGVFVVDSVGIY